MRPPAEAETPGLAILMAVLAVALFSASDVLAKMLSETLGSLQIAWIRYSMFSAVALAMLVRAGRSAIRPRRPLLQSLRAVFLLGSATFFVVGLGHLGVAEATAISFVAPAFITALSIPLLGEVVRLRRWAALIVGLTGVLVVVRPGAGAFQPAAVYPLASALCGAVMVIITRRIGADDRTETTLFWSGAIGLLLLTLSAPLWFSSMGGRELGLGALMGLIYVGGQYLLIVAYSRGQASVLAPFSYAQLLIATALGVFIFGATPDALTLGGIGLIILGGGYTLYREGVLSRFRLGALRRA